MKTYTSEKANPNFKLLFTSAIYLPTNEVVTILSYNQKENTFTCKKKYNAKADMLTNVKESELDLL